MVETSGARIWGATKALGGRRVGASHMVEASGARSWDATRVFKDRRVGAKHMMKERSRVIAARAPAVLRRGVLSSVIEVPGFEK
jgi:hypothetical protein